MEHKEFQDVLTFAIEKEEEAAAFYQEASRKAEKSHMKEAFLSMAEEEQKHKELLTNLDVEKVAEKKIESVADLKISDYLVDVKYSPDMEYQDVLILAMKREKKAFQLYTNIADRTDDTDIQKLFQVLAQEEAKHKLKLETEYDEHVMEGY
ncbi:MAG: ferritin family protein [Gemmatimonadota bacterium]|nr:MAG: ferritin family protein [Gemmatimonadota bacterium]